MIFHSNANVGSCSMKFCLVYAGALKNSSENHCSSTTAPTLSTATASDHSNNPHDPK